MTASTTVGAGARRETHGPVMEPLATSAHLLQPVIKQVTLDPSRAAAAYREGDRFVDVSWGEFLGRVRRIAKGLIDLGVQAGDRVALMSRSRVEWLLADYAILAAGAVTVPVYETSSADQLQWIVGDSEAVLLIVETPTMATTFSTIAGSTPMCRGVFVIDGGGLDELSDRGDGIDDATLDGRIAALTTDHLATIVYTSGTTSRPKGCALTHGNLRTNVMQNLDAIGAMLGPAEVSLVFLPLAHILTKIIALVGVESGIKMAFATDIAHLREELAMVRPTMVVGVPRVFEKIYNGAQHQAHATRRGPVFDRAVEVAVRWSENNASGRRGPVTALEHRVFDGLVYRRLRTVFGGRLRFAFSGGGPLGERLTHFFSGIGIRIFEGYGLTETSPTLTVNRAEAWKPGTVGLAVAGTAIRLEDDGEIVVAGPQVFKGYWRDEVATAEAFEKDGWFRTGDIGEVDSDGFLRITGRKKELIITAGGKNVAPAPLEDRLRAHPLISQAVVVGDGRPFIAALVALDPEAVSVWAAERGLGEVPMPQLIEDVGLRAAIQAAVDDANLSVSRAESIRSFALLPGDLTIARQELTPTLKVRRMVVEEHYRNTIDQIYGSAVPPSNRAL